MSRLYDLIQPGLRTELGSHTFERDEILEFARQYDPQRFHVDEAAARNAMFGALCASGWHTASVWMKLNIENGRSAMCAALDHDGDMPFGVSPGMRNLRWPRPVFVGDTVSYASEVTAKRATSGRKGWGIVVSHCTGTNQDGALVVSFSAAVTIRVD